MNRRAPALYICYQSAFEPLTDTQVVAYLEGVALAGHDITLLTFEPSEVSAQAEATMRTSLLRRGVRWEWVRYHRRPSLAATAYDVAVGVVVGRRLIARHRIGLVHARSHVAALIALRLQRQARVPFIFDVRGFLAEEYVDAGVWTEGGFIFRLTKRVERKLLSAAAQVVVLTERARLMLLEEYPEVIDSARITVIPCCVDMRVAAKPAERSAAAPLVYVGKFGGWYWTEAMVGFVVALRALANKELRILTQSPRGTVERELQRHGLNSGYSIERARPEDVREVIQAAAAGLSFILPMRSKLASSPTKVGEYLAAGLPVIANSGIGDLDELLQNGGQPVGVTVHGTSRGDYERAAVEFIRLSRIPGLPERCIRAARQFLDLESIGWTRYREVYRRTQ